MKDFFDEKINPEERVAFWKVLEELGKRIGHGKITIQIYDERVEDLNITFASKPLKFPEGFNKMMEHIGMEELVDRKDPGKTRQGP
jgi:hypothetical protein